VAALLEFAALPLEVIKFAINDDADALVFVRDRLIARRQIDDAQPRVPEPGALVR
jgi:hypothetical protein